MGGIGGRAPPPLGWTVPLQMKAPLFRYLTTSPLPNNLHAKLYQIPIYTNWHINTVVVSYLFYQSPLQIAMTITE